MSMADLNWLYRSEIELVDSMGSDERICQAAKVSMEGINDSGTLTGLINYLAACRHGSPFEHGVITFAVKAPIFVFREWHRHRLMSYNEMSGRYTVLRPDFYLPPPNRPLVNVGTSARPKMVPGTAEQHQLVVESLSESYLTSWHRYQKMLDAGIAKEVARDCLPVGIYSQMFVTVNVRSLLNFLSLRVNDPDGSAFPSYALWEIDQAAREVEAIFADLFPTTHEAFVTNRRVAP